MKLREIYEQAVRLGIEADLRGEEEVKRILTQTQKEFEELKEEDKPFFDAEKLFNPFSDTRILYGNDDVEVKRILAGIDMEVGEVLLADRLREKGAGVDLILSHHPEGMALAALYEVMHLQEDILYGLGVPVNVAEGLLASRISEVHRGLMPLNHNRAVDAARLLDFPLMCVHTPADNLVTRFLNQLFSEKNPRTVGEVVKVLKEIPEYQEARKIKAGPEVIVGSEKKRAGKIYVDMTGGTSGSSTAYEKLAQAGVGTVVVMHMPEKHRTEAEKNHLNVVIAGHIASDSLGLNLFLDTLEPQGVEILPCSGLIRVRR
ncbi:MAG: NGG1p interacting factor NIF3 [Syntrophomonadaceae bacterium]|nr:NGG1p interacting factor NIF3 [Syntrophomonadaceae bacterium]